MWRTRTNSTNTTSSSGSSSIPPPPWMAGSNLHPSSASASAPRHHPSVDNKSSYSSLRPSASAAADFHSMSFSSAEFNCPWAAPESRQGSFWQRTLDGFRRDSNYMISYRGGSISTAGGGNGRGPIGGEDGRTFDAERAAIRTADSPLMRRLKGRHLQMIAFGGSIGTGLFVGSGRALANGGPASLLIAYGIIGLMLYCTVHALGEMAVAFPVAGSFAAYSTRFLDPAWGFAMGWNYAVQWLVVLPLETVAASIVVGYWETGISNAVFVTIFLFSIMTINLFGVKGYGEAEFVFSILKVIAIIGFIILGVVLNIGGGPNGSYIGGTYWLDPGAFNNSFKGLCSVFVTAAFAFAGTELVGLAAAETSNPRKTLPTAIKQVFWRICLFYIVSLLIVGLLVRYDDPDLLGDNDHDTRASPFVIAIRNAGISGLDSVMNAVILVAVISVGNSAVYGSSRTLAALAEQGQAPSFLAYIDRKGRPLAAILVAGLIGLLAYLAVTPAQEGIFNWLMSLSGLSSILTWGSICLSHIRFRRAWRVQGRSLDELAFRSQPGVLGSWIGFAINVMVLVAQFWTGLFPIGAARDHRSGQGGHGTSVLNFFQAYLCAPIVIVFYISYKVWFRTKVIRVRDINLDIGMRELDVKELLADESAEQAAWPTWKRWYKIVC